jgi:hypothetical protein
MSGVPQKLNLDKINVFYEDVANEYFSIEGLNHPLSYGKRN